MRTVEQSHFAFVIGSFALDEEHVQAGLVCGEFSGKLAQVHVLCCLDNPEVEDFSLYNEVVCIADLLLDVGNLFARETWYNAVNQRSANVAILGEPGLELLVVATEVLFPQLNILVDTLLQVVAVEEDELARHDDQTFVLIALEGLEATIEQLGQLTGVRRSGSVSELAVGVESDTGFCSVRDNETDFGLVGQGHEG